jgi:hypothetical protein
MRWVYDTMEVYSDQSCVEHYQDTDPGKCFFGQCALDSQRQLQAPCTTMRTAMRTVQRVLRP